jgi:hypothetical protein
MSTNKGFPSQKKPSNNLTPYDREETDTRSEFVTAQRTYSDKIAQDAAVSGLYRLHASPKVLEAGATYPLRELKITAHGAKKGDVVRFEVGSTNPGFEANIQTVPNANTIILAAELAVNSAVGDEVYLLRYITPRYTDDGAQAVLASQGPVQFVLDSVDTEVARDTAVSANSKPLPVIQLDAAGLPIDYATATLQTAQSVLLGAVTETAPATDTASSGLNGRLQRVAQRLTSLISLIPTSLGPKTSAASFSVTLASDQSTVPVSGPLTDTQLRATAVPISAAALPLPTGAATSALQTAEATLIGAVNETAPATDTASSGLNGRLQRVAQRITSLIALVPASLGAKTSAASFSVVLASDQAAVPTSAPVNTAGSIVNTALVGTTATAVTKPANAVGFILQAASSNSDNIRWCAGSTASTTVGMLAEPGRDSGYIPLSSNLSVCAVASTVANAFSIQWVLSA